MIGLNWVDARTTYRAVPFGSRRIHKHVGRPGKYLMAVHISAHPSVFDTAHARRGGAGVRCTAHWRRSAFAVLVDVEAGTRSSTCLPVPCLRTLTYWHCGPGANP